MSETKNSLLELKPVKKFINKIGPAVKKYFGREQGCIVGIEDDGVFYGRGLYQWLRRDSDAQKFTFTTMDGNGKGLDEDKARERKVLLVDNDIVTGGAYRKAMNFIMDKKEELKIKDVKFAVLCDRMKVADFSVEDYPVPSSWSLKDLDRIDLAIIKSLSQNGRNTFVEIAQETGLTPVGIKKRVGRLFEREVIKIQCSLNTAKFYSVSATIGIEAAPKTISGLIKKFASCPLVYNLVKVSGHHNLVVDMIAPDFRRINDLIEKQLRSNSDIRSIEVNLGELPLVPKTHTLPNFADKSKKCPCERKCNECEYYL